MGDYAYERAEHLQATGFEPTQFWDRRRAISVSENGKSYKAAIAAGMVSAVFQVDGDIIRNGQKCDKFLAVVDSSRPAECGTAVFIELKGKDVAHAVDQLEQTIRNDIFLPYPKPGERTRARIITANCGPKSSSKIKLEEARIRFKRMYNVELRVLKNNQADSEISR